MEQIGNMLASVGCSYDEDFGEITYGHFDPNGKKNQDSTEVEHGEALN